MLPARVIDSSWSPGTVTFRPPVGRGAPAQGEDGDHPRYSRKNSHADKTAEDHSSEPLAAVDDLVASAAKSGDHIDIKEGFLLDSVLAKRGSADPAQVSALKPVARLARVFGLPVIVIRQGEGTSLRFNGVSTRTALFITADSQYPLHGVLGHELLHDMQRHAPDLYASIAKDLIPNLVSVKEDAEKMGLRDVRPADVHAEIIAAGLG